MPGFFKFINNLLHPSNAVNNGNGSSSGKERNTQQRQQHRKEDEDDYGPRTSSDAAIDKYLFKKFVNYPNLPNVVERRFYRSMLDVVISNIMEMFNTSHVNFMSHRLRLNVSLKEEPDTEAERKTTAKLRKNRATAKFKSSKLRGGFSGDSNASDDDSVKYNQRAIIALLVDKCMEERVRKKKLVYLLPPYVEKRLNSNFVYMLLCTCEETLSTSFVVDVMGQKMTIDLSRAKTHVMKRDISRPILSESSTSSDYRDSPGDNLASLFDFDDKNSTVRSQSQTTTDQVQQRSSSMPVPSPFTADPVSPPVHLRNPSTTNKDHKDDLHVENCIDRIVDDIMAQHTVFPVPDYIERHLYNNSLHTLLDIMEDILDTSQVTVLNHTLKCELVPGTPQKLGRGATYSQLMFDTLMQRRTTVGM
jgi:hypothetical protein